MEFRFKAEGFAKQQRELLNMEFAAEQQEAVANKDMFTAKELETKGIAMNKLKVTEVSSGLYGKLLIHLESAKKHNVNAYAALNIDYSKYDHEEYLLPPTKIGSGDIVGIYQYAEHLAAEPLVSGVVYRQNLKEVVVAVDKAAQRMGTDLSELHLTLLEMPNDVTHKRCLAAIEAVGDPSRPEIPFLWEVLLGIQDPRVKKSVTPEPTIVPFNIGLNESQISAVAGAMQAIDLYLIHGPPGTGKTTTVVEYIMQEAMRGNKVLACGPSNMSVDNMVEKLVAVAGKKLRICRVGHPARMMQSVWQTCLDAQVDASEEAVLARKAKQALNKLLPKVLKAKSKDERRELRTECKMLKKDIKRYEKQAVDAILAGSNVILATNTGIGDRRMWGFLSKRRYVVVIDEAAQAIEASCWIPIQLSDKLILAGDHKQLAPTIKSFDAAKKGLEITLFERLIKKYEGKHSSLLDIQYRMNSTIMNWCSAAMYGGHLKADKSVADTSLRGKKKAVIDKLGEDVEEAEQVISKDMLLVDTSGCGFGESVDAKDENDSKYNVGYGS